MNKALYEILIIDNDYNIIYRHYYENTSEGILKTAHNAILFYNKLDNTNYSYQIIKIK